MYVHVEGERWRRSIFWNSGRWTVTKPPMAGKCYGSFTLAVLQTTERTWGVQLIKGMALGLVSLAEIE